jgi:HAD superfamily hydrolase (TIGR01549 family)
MHGHPNILPRAMLFDMDGTLTEPMLDFPKIKAEMGIGSRPILEALAEMSSERRAEAEAILLRHEDRAAARSTLNPGCRELLAHLHESGIATALITRNSRRSVEIVVRLHSLKFETVIAREDGPFKPSPVPLHLACRKLAVVHSRAWMVGDGQYDIEAARAALIAPVWVSHGRARPFETTPWREVRDLGELLSMVKACEAALPRDASSHRPGPASA